MDDQEELEYIRRTRSGEHAAYAKLVDRYKTFAYAIALKVLKNQEDAEDVTQESFIKAFQQLHQFEGKAKFSTWLYTIVYRTALAKTREMKVKLFSITDQLRGSFTNDHSSPQLALIQANDEKRSVEQAIANLPETEALLVMLYYIEEKSIREIHAITSLSAANIKSNCFAREKNS